jgi:hypothetical protein
MSEDNTQGGAEPSSASAGSQPVAWAVNHAHGTTVWDSETQARKVANEWLASRVWVWAEVVPLYRQPQPTLTDSERKAVEWFSRFARPQNGPVIGRHAATLLGLLERLG